jgi:uncharacterized protein YhbP (UPF0306 family)
MSAILVSPDYSSERLHQVVAHILQGNMLCSMATRGEREQPHIHAAFFAFSDELALYFLSHPDSVHCRNLARAPDMAVSVFDGRQPWGAAHQGLQLFGRCARATGPDEDRGRELYAARFPLYVDFARRPAEGGGTTASSFLQRRFYAFTPDRVKILDEDEFGDEVLVMAEVVNSSSSSVH